ncbi:chorismate dehydratase [Candidatus Electrothrix aarhusensis]|uniref:Chorismate dehydratase n=1 Tax=Candidatus Electrothrix aarhusensis TaxID=1859131 RepID=A0A444IZD3_9BACT|nr:chorismate dehydratase [Candidatus Electrothrix aarhusensis]
MSSMKKALARLGMVNYINTAPIYEVWKEQVQRPDWPVTEAPPAQLNQLLAAGELDLGFVSSYEYAARPEQYRIMADLSISATGPVGSVFMFSSVPPEELEGKQMLMTGQSDTSVWLLRIILEDFFLVKPEYTSGEVFGAREPANEPAAVLAIGDEALRLATETNSPYPVQIDLAEFWHQQTGLPFVFSVCAVREDFLATAEDTARDLHQTLLSCRDQGRKRLPEISERAAHRIPMDPTACLHYLQAMEYDLSPAKLEALEEFFSRLIRHGAASAKALPLKIFR